ncbi:hypothetical protein CHO01_00180 [Cellulomonas hominis]|uniref:Trehalose/maltose hydrolase-like predicted phosphorylase n=1 Tax=Cellulomonas hominis TaxID=156981 RepID=A0A511F6I9_9CELL|nr:hypothetical protein [Cellulomonas hominis]MBB5474876.1 trehalose/maltose hydrolase-like predicted phosphorylase [Cellulomonas hominis]GEL44902.1 hypothetical protein CHO01_00180 [Cellulomonas hominis]
MPDRPDPWRVRAAQLDLDHPGAAASVLTLANGALGVRGVPDSPAPDRGPGTLLAGVWEEFDHTYAERAYGYPLVDERLVPVVDAWALGWAADGAPVADTGATRVLDLRRLLEREIEVRTPGGARLTLTATRLVSLVRREVVATRWHVRAHDAARVTALPVPGCGHADATGADDLDPEPGLGTTHCRHEPGGSVVHQRAHRSGRALAARTGHAVRAGDGTRVAWHPGPHAATLDADLPAGGWLEVEVLAAYAAGTDADALDGRAGRALAEARAAGWDRLLREQEAALDAVWERGDVRVEGDDVLQQAVRYALFQVVQASARVEGSGVRAKGLAGTGYHGHTFWDSECFVLPVLDHVLPEAAQAHLRWRHGTLALARERAAELGLPGAAFPWRTISGRECSGYWPAGTAAFHVGADVAFAAARHVATTGDEDFAREVGVDLLVATARLWAGRGHHAADGFHLDGVTGPDEYTAVVDDNAYTNLMARRNLRGAADAAERFPAEAGRLGVTADERAAWRRAADRMVVPYSPTWASPSSTPGSPGTRPGTSAPRRPPGTRWPTTRRSSSSTAARSSSRPTSCSPCTWRARRSTPSRSAGTSPTTSRSPSATRPCPPPRRRWSPRRWGTRTWRTRTPGSARSSTCRTCARRPRGACTSPRSRARGPRWWPGWAGCGTTTARCTSRRGCRGGSRASCSGCSRAAPGPRSTCDPAR